jgi:hypothetical protein
MDEILSTGDVSATSEGSAGIRLPLSDHPERIHIDSVELPLWKDKG